MQQQPVLLQGLHLATCSLANTMEKRNGHQAPAAATAESTQGQHQKPTIPVLCSPSDTNRFMAADMSKNLPGSYYHLRKPETSVLPMAVGDWLDAWQAWDNSRLLLQVLTCRR